MKEIPLWERVRVVNDNGSQHDVLKRMWTCTSCLCLLLQYDSASASSCAGNNTGYGFKTVDRGGRVFINRMPHCTTNGDYSCYCETSLWSLKRCQRPGRTFCSRGNCIGRPPAEDKNRREPCLWSGISTACLRYCLANPCPALPLPPEHRLAATLPLTSLSC